VQPTIAIDLVTLSSLTAFSSPFLHGLSLAVGVGVGVGVDVDVDVDVDWVRRACIARCSLSDPEAIWLTSGG
jgi:hypothetical protein